MKPKMYWWNGADLRAFLADLNGRDLDNTRVEFHTDTELLHIVDTTAEASTTDEGGYNFSHVCPPNCP